MPNVWEELYFNALDTCDHVKNIKDKNKREELMKNFAIVKANTKSTDVFYRLFHKVVFSSSGRF